MRIIRAKDYEDMSRKAAHLIAAKVLLKPACVLGLATGSSPLGLYKNLIEWNRRGDIDFSGVTTVNLDEYAGLPPENEQSYTYFMNQNLFDHINIRKKNTHLPNGTAQDAAAECARYNAVIRGCGGIDMQLLGIGGNGHIGFNEPGETFSTDTHLMALSESTVEANKRFFTSAAEVPRRAYTMGVRTIMQARRVLLIASGKGKAAVLREALCGPVTPRLPASILQLHADVTLVADAEALSLL